MSTILFITICLLRQRPFLPGSAARRSPDFKKRSHDVAFNGRVCCLCQSRCDRTRGFCNVGQIVGKILRRDMAALRGTCIGLKGIVESQIIAA
jgi:hypothetical protein